MRWRNGDWVQENASDRLISCDEADKARSRSIMMCLVCVISGGIGGLLFYFANSIPFMVLLLFASMYGILGVLIFGAFLWCVRLSSRRWRLTSGRVEFCTSGLFASLEAGVILFLAAGAVVALWLSIFLFMLVNTTVAVVLPELLS